MATPTKATPAGCVLGLFGFFSLILAGMCVLGLWTTIHRSPKDADPNLLWKLPIGAAAGGVTGIILIRVGWKMALRADMKEPDDPTKPMIRY